MFNVANQQQMFGVFIWLQIIATILTVIFIKINPSKKLFFFNLNQYTVLIIQLLTLWNLAALPLTLNFYIKINMIINSKHPSLVMNTVLTLLNTLIVWVYLNTFTEQKLINPKIAKIISSNYTLIFILIALTVLFYIYPIPLFPRL